MAKSKKQMSEEERARYYEERRDDDSLWSETPVPVRIRKDVGTLFSLRLPAEELETLRQEADKKGTTVSALLRDGARLLVQMMEQNLQKTVDLDFVKCSLPTDLHKRVLASRPLIETILEEQQDTQNCVNLLIELGLERLLTDIMGKVESEVLLKAMLQYAARAPEVVYGHTVEMLTLGAEANAESQEAAGTMEARDSDIIDFRKKVEERAEKLRSQRASTS